MENIGFNKKALIRLKEELGLENQSLNLDIFNFLVDEISGINFENVDEKSKIEIEKGKYLNFYLKSKKDNIDLNIDMFDGLLEMSVANSGYPVYDQYPINGNEEKIKINLRRWISCDIRKESFFSRDKLKKDVFYAINDDNEVIIHKSFYLNKFIFRTTNKVIVNYKRWK